MKVLIDRALYTELIGALRDTVGRLEMLGECENLQEFYDLLKKVKGHNDGSISLNGLNARVVKTLKDLYTSLGELMIAMDEDLALFYPHNAWINRYVRNVPDNKQDLNRPCVHEYNSRKKGPSVYYDVELVGIKRDHAVSREADDDTEENSMKKR